MTSISEDTSASKEPSNTPKTQLDFIFYGRGSEFFGVWIVNVLLTVLTLGIYSAWAKVRTNRYFYSNTQLGEFRFSYLAEPMQILKGRIIAILVFGLFYLASSLSPIVNLIGAIGLVFLMPFLICSSLRFDMRMSSYRNVKFDFKGKYWDAFINFILLPIGSVFTLYLALPWALKRMDSFLIGNSYYGEKQFKPELSTGSYYLAALATIIITLILFAIFAVVLAATGSDIFNIAQAEGAQPEMSFAFIYIILLYILLISFVSAFYQAYIRNHIFKHTELEDVAEFDSQFDFVSLAWLQVSNLLLIVVTLGFAYPFTKVRLANYTIGRTDVIVLDNDTDVFDNIEQGNSAIGDEVANVFDIDIALT